MASPFIGEIRIVGFPYAQSGWAQCNGQLLPILQNTALFTILGTTYGGDGVNTFALPYLTGSAPVGAGQGQGLSSYAIGESGGVETVALQQSEVPAHTHTVRADATDPANQSAPTSSRVLARSRPGRRYQSDAASNLTAMAPSAVTPAGGFSPHNNMPPVLTMMFIIALQGDVPARQ